MSELADVKLPGDDAEDGVVEPKRCWFCGENDEVGACGGFAVWGWIVRCGNCGACGPFGRTEEEAISAWNGRVV